MHKGESKLKQSKDILAFSTSRAFVFLGEPLGGLPSLKSVSADANGGFLASPTYPIKSQQYSVSNTHIHIYIYQVHIRAKTKHIYWIYNLGACAKQ